MNNLLKSVTKGTISLFALGVGVFLGQKSIKNLKKVSKSKKRENEKQLAKEWY